MDMLDNIYGVLFKPNTTFSELSNRKYFASSFLIIFLLALLTSVKDAIAYNSGGLSVLLLMIITFTFYMFVWVISGILLTFTSDLFGGTGKITDTLIGTAYASLPLIFVAPLYILSNVFGDHSTEIYSLIKLAIYLWFATLIILSIKYSHKIHFTQAILSFISIFVLFIVSAIGISTISVLGTIFIATNLL